MEEEKTYLPKDNSEIEKYLDYYIKLANPGYAVFLNGAWGSGKTWFIREFKRTRGEENFVHVSLYGVSSIEQINDQVFQQLYPRLASEKATIAAKTVKSISGLFGYSLDGIDIKAYLKLTTEKIFIFDDLERCDSPNLVLGFINRCIEHSGNRVIIIGEEEFLKKKDDTFKNQKEKTIGRSFTLYPEFRATFTHLVGIEAHASMKDLLQKHYSIIETCFARAECNNLRTLKFCVTEFHRFYEQLPSKAKKHDAFLTEAINTFFSLCVEVRSGNLNVVDIPEIQNTHSVEMSKRIAAGKSKEEIVESPLSILRKKHFGEGRNKIEPSLNMLYCFFKYGSIHPQMMNEAIDNSSYFFQADTPAWIKLWYSHSITDEDFAKCYIEVLKDYKNYKFTKVGILRHIAGIMLNYGQNEMLDMSYEEVVSLNETIIKEMTNKKLIEPEKDDDDFKPFDDISLGLQFQSLKDPNFYSISKLIKQGAQTKQDERNQEVSKRIPDLLMEDPIKFRALVAPGRSNDSEERLYKFPVMKYVSVTDFVNALVKMNPVDGGRFTILRALKDRYEHIHSYPALKEDLQWLLEVEKRMIEIMPDLKQPTKYQFSLLLINLSNIISAVRGVNEEVLVTSDS